MGVTTLNKSKCIQKNTWKETDPQTEQTRLQLSFETVSASALLASPLRAARSAVFGEDANATVVAGPLFTGCALLHGHRQGSTHVTCGRGQHRVAATAGRFCSSCHPWSTRSVCKRQQISPRSDVQLIPRHVGLAGCTGGPPHLATLNCLVHGLAHSLLLHPQSQPRGSR